MQHIRRLLLITFFASVSSGLLAVNVPPGNDRVADAIDLGTLPLPGFCPANPEGDTITVYGTTDFASYNTLNFSPAHCFPMASPDVWYRFRATGSFLYFEMTGAGNLDSFFVKLHHSQGSALALVPLHCETTTNGLIQVSMLTPEVGGEYYLQIGGSNPNETGAFTFWMKSYNECTGCVKNADIELTPAPWFGNYGTNDTVEMCVTVDRWDQTTSSNLHSIVPVFGDEWDTTTLTPVVFPSSASNVLWIWGQNIPTPAGSLDGFYFDADSNGDPTDNAGEPGNATTSWTGCWTIATKPFCNSYDATVEVYVFSDNQTGTGNSTAQCQEYWPIHLNLSGWCCPDPVVTVVPTGACSAYFDLHVTPVGNAGDTFTVTLYNDTLGQVMSAQNITGSTTFTGITSGDYLLEVHNISDGCISYHQVHGPAAFDVDMMQTAVGCGPGSGSVIATPAGGAAPFTYQWQGITTYTDSLAYNLDEGYATVVVTDAAGCSVTDSIYVSIIPTPDAYFDYSDNGYCHNDDTIQVYTHPVSLGGVYSLVAPTNGNITVDQATGIISLNSTNLPTPYYIYVQYTVGGTCTASFIDSVRIVQKPAAPVASGQAALSWCIGAAPPVLNIQIGTGIPLYYDVQTTAGGIGYSYTPPLNSNSTPGIYYYTWIYGADLSFNCSSAPLIFSINALTSPVFTMSPTDTICPGDTGIITATGSGAWSYSWDPPPTVGSQFVPYSSSAPQSTTTYTVTVSDGTCSSTGNATIVVLSAAQCSDISSEIHYYNGITPNGDGQNDTWVIDGIDAQSNVTVRIFNRWGKQVWDGYHYDNTSVVWTGNDNHGERLPGGTYFYIITQDNTEPVTGWIELTR